jgi:hypothetical protein
MIPHSGGVKAYLVARNHQKMSIGDDVKLDEDCTGGIEEDTTAALELTPTWVAEMVWLLARTSDSSARQK